MSHALIARSPDLRRLQEEGYTLRIVDGAYLLVDDVPYVTPEGTVGAAALVMPLTLADDITDKPTTHVARWTGEFPHYANGDKLLALLHDNAAQDAGSDSIPPSYQLSAKASGGYSDYHHKVATYVDILSNEARHLNPEATAKRWRVIGDNEDSDSVFHFADTASARQDTTDLARKLQGERVAIVGVGGTGSFVLDLVARTWVREIHLFDADPFLQHNAFRAPGPFSREDLGGGPRKASFHARRYSRMRKGVVPNDTLIDETNVQELAAFDTVFLCMDGHPIKANMVETCMANDTLLIDVGMGLHRAGDSLAGTLRTTTLGRAHHDHAEHCIDLAGGDAGDEYDRNVQLAELNALNAALAVIKWKKVRGFYSDHQGELNCEYVIDGNKLINSFLLGRSNEAA